MSYKRIEGGEKNIKSGQKWSKEEIIKVYYLFKKLNGVGLHEHNPQIQNLACELGRTVRSTEAQTLMFRSLERLGDYSHGNMNKLSLQVWNEYELKRNFQTVLSFENTPVVNGSQPLNLSTYSNQQKQDNKIENLIIDPDYVLIQNEIEDTETLIFNYKKWNKLLIEYFFNSKNEGKEVTCFFVYEELFDELSDFKYSFSDFELSIEKELRSKLFSIKFTELCHSSMPHMIGGRNLRKPIPEYFGLLTYLILSLGKSQSESLSIANVYARINN
ncbi:hypothetical protein N9K07_05230, partial [Arenitalea sp.]